jgi:hypothetical protein
MPATKRTPIYLDPAIYEVLKERAAAAKTSISKIVNDLVRQSLIDYEEELKTTPFLSSAAETPISQSRLSSPN